MGGHEEVGQGENCRRSGFAKLLLQSIETGPQELADHFDGVILTTDDTLNPAR